MLARRGLLRGAAALPVLPASGPARAGAPLSLLSGTRVGSAGDQWARGFAPFLERHLRRGVVGVGNRPGADGLDAVRAVARAQGDGNTLGLLLTPGQLASMVEHDTAELLDRLQLIGCMAEETLVLVVPPDSGTALPALRRLGENGVLATPPAGSGAQLAALPLRDALPLTALPFASALAARQAAQAGNVAAALLPLPDAIGALRDDRLVALAVATPGRCELLPEVPTFIEQGIPFRYAAQRGLVAPRALPAAISAAIAQAVQAVTEDPEFATHAASHGFTGRFLPGADWQPLVQQTLEALRDRWRRAPWAARAG